MSLQNLGKLKDVFDVVTAAGDSFDDLSKLGELPTALFDLSKSLDVDDAINAFIKLGLSGDNLCNALMMCGFEADAFSSKLGATAAAGASNVGVISKLKTVFQGLAVTLKPFVPLIIGAAAAFATFKAMQYLSFDGFYNRALEDQKALEETKSKIAESTSLLEENKNKVKELKEQKAATFGSSADEIDKEISKLEQENVVLEQRIKLNKEIQKTNEQLAASSASKALRQTDLYADAVSDPITGAYKTEYRRMSVLERLQYDIANANRLQSALDKNATAIGELDLSTKDGQKQFQILSNQRDDLNRELANTQNKINQQKLAIIDLYDALFDNDGNIISGYEGLVSEIQGVFPELVATAEETGSAVASALESATSSVDDLKNSVASAIQVQNDLTTALAAGNSATGMTAEQIDAVKKAFSRLEGFDMPSLFERTANGVRMNTEAFKQYSKILQTDNQIKILEAIKRKQDELAKAQADGNSEQISQLRNELSMLQLLSSEYEAAISKYNAYITATSSANSRDNYGNIVSGYKSVGELIKQGWVTDDSVISYLELVRGDNWNTDNNGKILSTAEAYKKLSENIKGTSHSLKDYLTTDSNGNLTSQGVWNFAQDAVKLGFGEIGEDGLVTLNLTGQALQDVATRFGTTTEMVELFGKALADAGMTVAFDPIETRIQNLEDTLKQKKKELEQLEGEAKVNKQREIALTTSALVKYKVDKVLEDGESITELLGLSMEEAQIKLGLDADNLEQEFNEAMDYLQEKGKESGEIPLNVKLDETQFNTLIGADLGQINVTAVVEEPPEIPDSTVKATAIVEEPPEIPDATGTANMELGESPDEVPDAEGIANYTLGSSPTYAPTIYGVAKYRGDFSGISAPTLSGKVNYSKTSGTMVSVAHADGTAYNVLNYQRLSPSHVSGRVSLPRDEYALTNEIGRESIVRNGVWYLLPPGPHMEHLKKGDIVFSAKQTQDLLNAGKTSTYAHAFSAGTISALENGTTHAYFTGSGYNPWANAGYVNPSTNAGSGSSSSSSSDSDEKEPEWVDFIEIALSRIKRFVEKFTNAASNAFKSLQSKLMGTSDAIKAITQELNVQSVAYSRYMTQANNVGLSTDLAESVRNGAYDIRQYDDETQKKINQYKEWYEKALACSDAIDELKKSLAELRQGKFDSVVQNYSNKIEELQYSANSISSKIDALDAKGYLDSISLYRSLMDTKKSEVSVLNQEYKDLNAALTDAMSSGEIEKYSDAWYEMSNQILAVKEELDKANISLIEYQNTIRETEWSYFDFTQDRIAQLTEEANFLIDLMSGKDLYADNGQLSETGLATVGLHGMNYNTYMKQADQYAAEVKKLNAEIAKDPNNTKLIERKEELLGLQRESINAAKQEKQAIVDMVENGIDVQLDSIQELIDKYNDALDSAKDFNDYQKKIRDQTSELSNLNKQLMAYAGDDSEETRATVQKLQTEIKKAEEELDETEYQQYITDQKKLLDELYDAYETNMNQRLDNIDALIEDMIGSINSNSGAISDTLHEIAEKNGYALSDSLNSVWSSSTITLNNTITSYGDDFQEKLTGIGHALEEIQSNTSAMAENSNSSKHLYNDIPAFASGGLAKHTGLAHLDGTPSKPELVLNPKDTENLLAIIEEVKKKQGNEIFIQSFMPYSMKQIPQIAHSVSSLDIERKLVQSISQTSSNDGDATTTFGDINIQIDHVKLTG